MQTCFSCASEEEMRLVFEVSAEANQKSLTLLRAIDFTIEALTWVEKQVNAPVPFIQRACDSIRNCERKAKIDESGIVSSAALSAEEAATELYNVLLDKKALAFAAAKELDGPDREAVVEAYARLIAAAADLHNVVADLRWAIGEHDADLDESSGAPLSTAEEIAAYLDAL